MVDELKIIQAEITSIIDELDGANLIPTDENKLSEIRFSIVGLLEHTMNYLNKINSSLTSWQKERIVETINALYWDWLHLAINSINLAIADPSTISSENKYNDEIVKLTFDDLNKQILLLKHRIK